MSLSLRFACAFAQHFKQHLRSCARAITFHLSGDLLPLLRRMVTDELRITAISATLRTWAGEDKRRVARWEDTLPAGGATCRWNDMLEYAFAAPCRRM